MDVPTEIEIHTGTREPYRWLVTTHYLDALLELCPEVATGKYVAVTTRDSGPVFLSEGEIASGWTSRENIAYSPLITNPGSIPRECWDEWYVLNSQVDIGPLAASNSNIFTAPEGQVHPFVNFDMRLHRSETDLLIEIFWREMDRIRPYAYVAESDYRLTLATADKNLFTKAVTALTTLKVEEDQ